MKILNYHFFFAIILFLYIGNEDKNVLAQELIHTCKNIVENCYRLNEMLSPCFANNIVDFRGTIFALSLGANTFAAPKCSCSQEFYSNLVACGKSCDIPVDDPLKFESDCRIANRPVNLGGAERGSGSSPSTPNKASGTDTSTSNFGFPNTGTQNTSSSNTGIIVGAVVSIVGVIGGVIIAIIKCRGNRGNNRPNTYNNGGNVNIGNITYVNAPTQPHYR